MGKLSKQKSSLRHPWEAELQHLKSCGSVIYSGACLVADPDGCTQTQRLVVRLRNFSAKQMISGGGYWTKGAGGKRKCSPCCPLCHCRWYCLLTQTPVSSQPLKFARGLHVVKRSCLIWVSLTLPASQWFTPHLWIQDFASRFLRLWLTWICLVWGSNETHLVLYACSVQ